MIFLKYFETLCVKLTGWANVLIEQLLHQSFVSMAPLGSGSSGTFNFTVFNAKCYKHWGQICGEIPAERPSSTEAYKNVEQLLLGVVLMKKK